MLKACTMKLLIDFANFLDEPRKLISGRNIGRSYREKLGGDEFFVDCDQISLSVPDTTKVITPSVFLGLIGKEIEKFGDIEQAKKNITLTGATTVTEDNLATALRTTFFNAL